MGRSQEVPWRLELATAAPTVGPGRTLEGTLATLSAPGWSTGAITARISWGDGTTSTGTVTGTPPTPTSVNGLYTVSGSHRYGHAGVHLVTVTATASGTPPAMTVYFVRVGSVTG